MTDQRLRISFSDLPPRPRPLGDSELSRVFGGCQMKICTKDSHCCYPRRCNIIPNSNPAWGSCGATIG